MEGVGVVEGGGGEVGGAVGWFLCVSVEDLRWSLCVNCGEV